MNHERNHLKPTILTCIGHATHEYISASYVIIIGFCIDQGVSVCTKN